MKGKVSDLQGVTSMLRDRSLTRVASVVAHMSEVEAAIAKIDDGLREDTAARGISPARLTNVRQIWRDKMLLRRAELIRQLARLRADHEVILTEARSAVAKADLVTRLSRSRPGR